MSTRELTCVEPVITTSKETQVCGEEAGWFVTLKGETRAMCTRHALRNEQMFGATVRGVNWKKNS